MKDNRFWRLAAAAAILGVFYVGYGLQSDSRDAAPSLLNAAHAGGVAAIDHNAVTNIYTTSADGRYLYCWTKLTTGLPKFTGVVSVPVGPISDTAAPTYSSDDFQPERPKKPLPDPLPDAPSSDASKPKFRTPAEPALDGPLPQFQKVPEGKPLIDDLPSKK